MSGRGRSGGLTNAQQKAVASSVALPGNCPNTLDASVTYSTASLLVAASQTVTLTLAGVAALPLSGITLDVAAGGAGGTLAFSGGALHDASSSSIALAAGSTYTVRPSGTVGVVFVNGGARL